MTKIKVPKVLTHPDGSLYCEWDLATKRYKLTITDEDAPLGNFWRPVIVVVQSGTGEVLAPYEVDDE